MLLACVVDEHDRDPPLIGYVLECGQLCILACVLVCILDRLGVSYLLKRVYDHESFR